MTIKHEDGSEFHFDLSGPEAMRTAVENVLATANELAPQLPSTPEADAFLAAMITLGAVQAVADAVPTKNL